MSVLHGLLLDPFDMFDTKLSFDLAGGPPGGPTLSDAGSSECFSDCRDVGLLMRNGAGISVGAEGLSFTFAPSSSQSESDSLSHSSSSSSSDSA